MSYWGALGGGPAVLAPTRRAMEILLKEAEAWAVEYNVTFSTDPNPSKSKCKLVFMCGRQTGLPKPAPIMLCVQTLSWVASATHLGHTIHESGLMDQDIKCKRAELISKSLEVRQIFGFASPVETLAAIQLYCSSYYGSLAGWELGGETAASFYSVWRNNVVLTWNLPRATQTYIVQNHFTSPFTCD